MRTDLWEMLANIERQVRLAGEALADEREGDLTRAVEAIGNEARDAVHLVRTW